jgi:hypothetical protein
MQHTGLDATLISTCASHVHQARFRRNRLIQERDPAYRCASVVVRTRFMYIFFWYVEYLSICVASFPYHEHPQAISVRYIRFFSCRPVLSIPTLIPFSVKLRRSSTADYPPPCPSIRSSNAPQSIALAVLGVPGIFSYKLRSDTVYHPYRLSTGKNTLS